MLRRILKLVFLPGLKFVPCPACSVTLAYETFRHASSVLCPSCRAILRISDRFLRTAALASLVVSLAIVWLIDLKTEAGALWILLFALCFLLLPLLLVWVMSSLESDCSITLMANSLLAIRLAAGATVSKYGESLGLACRTLNM